MPRPARRARLAVTALALLTLGMRYPPPHEIGSVLLARRAHAAKVPGVQFEHWRHRARFTCRVCHVDVGFAMLAGETGISASTNRSGFHCGACHDGKRTFRGRRIFPACAEGSVAGEACRRCHAPPNTSKARSDYEAFAADLPRNPQKAIDWEKAEATGAIRPYDFLEGVSVPRAALRMDKDVQISASAKWMSDIIFSHKKHAVWNGCEVCHPEIFPATEAGSVKFTMLEIADGQYCGACHERVAFPLADCEGCHRRPVR